MTNVDASVAGRPCLFVGTKPACDFVNSRRTLLGALSGFVNTSVLSERLSRWEEHERKKSSCASKGSITENVPWSESNAEAMCARLSKSRVAVWRAMVLVFDGHVKDSLKYGGLQRMLLNF